MQADLHVQLVYTHALTNSVARAQQKVPETTEIESIEMTFCHGLIK